MKIITDKILENTEMFSFSNLIYNGIKEIIINGIKANLKRIIFSKHNINLNNPDDIEIGMQYFRDFLINNNISEIEKVLVKSGYYLTIYFYFQENGLRIDVINNSELTDWEEDHIREKFKEASKYDNIMDFLDEHNDEGEGAGLGIFLFILLLRKMNIDSSHFRVGKAENGYTLSRIEIPFNENYKSFRQ